jgi:hypothetical protein
MAVKVTNNRDIDVIYKSLDKTFKQNSTLPITESVIADVKIFMKELDKNSSNVSYNDLAERITNKTKEEMGKTYWVKTTSAISHLFSSRVSTAHLLLRSLNKQCLSAMKATMSTEITSILQNDASYEGSALNGPITKKPSHDLPVMRAITALIADKKHLPLLEDFALLETAWNTVVVKQEHDKLFKAEGKESSSLEIMWDFIQARWQFFKGKLSELKDSSPKFVSELLEKGSWLFEGAPTVVDKEKIPSEEASFIFLQKHWKTLRFNIKKLQKSASNDPVKEWNLTMLKEAIEHLAKRVEKLECREQDPALLQFVDKLIKDEQGEKDPELSVLEWVKGLKKVKDAIPTDPLYDLHKNNLLNWSYPRKALSAAFLGGVSLPHKIIRSLKSTDLQRLVNQLKGNFHTDSLRLLLEELPFTKVDKVTQEEIEANIKAFLLQMRIKNASKCAAIAKKVICNFSETRDEEKKRASAFLGKNLSWLSGVWLSISHLGTRRYAALRSLDAAGFEAMITHFNQEKEILKKGLLEEHFKGIKNHAITALKSISTYMGSCHRLTKDEKEEFTKQFSHLETEIQACEPTSAVFSPRPQLIYRLNHTTNPLEKLEEIIGEMNRNLRQEPKDEDPIADSLDRSHQGLEPLKMSEKFITVLSSFDPFVQKLAKLRVEFSTDNIDKSIQSLKELKSELSKPEEKDKIAKFIKGVTDLSLDFDALTTPLKELYSSSSAAQEGALSDCIKNLEDLREQTQQAKEKYNEKCDEVANKILNEEIQFQEDITLQSSIFGHLLNPEQANPELITNADMYWKKLLNLKLF